MTVSTVEAKNQPHRRLNPLTGEHILVSPQRALRPWKGEIGQVESLNIPEYEHDCYLCPGNKKVDGTRNPKYSSTYVFRNSSPAILPLEKKPSLHKINRVNSLFSSEITHGDCEVVCYSPNHGKKMASMAQKGIKKIITTWIKRYKKLGKRSDISYVQIFENRGPMMGSSQPHPHGQIWATSVIPNEPAKELARQTEYFNRQNSLMLLDYERKEREKDERVLFTNDSFTVLVPYWATWPYETMILPRIQIASIDQLNKSQITDLAQALSVLTKTYDALFDVSMPYSMGIHQSPTDGQDHDYQTMHFHFYPPLLRSATVKKFMVGFEMLAMPQRDITSEQAAQRLKEVMRDVKYLIF